MELKSPRKEEQFVEVSGGTAKAETLSSAREHTVASSSIQYAFVIKFI